MEVSDAAQKSPAETPKRMPSRTFPDARQATMIAAPATTTKNGTRRESS